MPEGDTIHRTASRLRAVLAGRPLTRVELPRVAPPLPRPGARVCAVEARGKHLLLHLDERGVARHPALRRLGPDLCDPDADIDLATHRLFSLSAPGRPVGEALLDQRIACGVGNVYRCDVLFLAGLHPWTAVSHLAAEEGRALLDLAVGLLSANLAHARRTTVADGAPGALWVHGRGGRPCRRCATPVAVDRLGAQARYVYWCPRCQPRGR